MQLHLRSHSDRIRRSAWFAFLWVVWIGSIGKATLASADSTLAAGKAAAFDLVDNKITFDVITDHGALRLQLDTGSPVVILMPDAARRLGFPQTSGSTLSGRPSGALATARIGAAALRRIPFFVFSPAMLLQWNVQHPDQRIDGLLGLSALRDMAIGVDMLRKRACFWEKGHVAAAEAGGFLGNEEANSVPSAAALIHRAPLILAGGRASVDVTFDEVQTRLILDTGAPLSMAGGRLAPYMRPLGIATSLGMADRMHTGDLRVTPTVAVGDYRFPYALFATVDTPEEDLPIGVLGLSVIQNCRIILDFPARAMLFTTYSTPQDPVFVRLFEWGLVTLRSTEGWIALPLSGSEVVRAGLEPRDRVKACNHKTLDRLTEADLTPLPDAVGGGLTLTVLRAVQGVLQEVEVTLPWQSLTAAHIAPPAIRTRVQLEPGTPVRFALPAGGTYYPAAYTGPIPEAAASLIRRTPAGGTLIENPPIASPVNVPPTQHAPPERRTLYTAAVGSPVTIAPGGVWKEEIGGGFSVWSPEAPMPDPLNSPIHAR